MLESLISETQSLRLIKMNSGYMHIKPAYKNLLLTNDIQNYHSTLNPLNKEELKKFINETLLI